MNLKAGEYWLTTDGMIAEIRYVLGNKILVQFPSQSKNYINYKLTGKTDTYGYEDLRKRISKETHPEYFL